MACLGGAHGCSRTGIFAVVAAVHVVAVVAVNAACAYAEIRPAAAAVRISIVTGALGYLLPGLRV